MESVEDCARVGTDFVAVRDGVWSHPDGPAAAVTAINAILDRVEADGEGAA
jgi:thiamine-phosphate pyrophosphorylase